MIRRVPTLHAVVALSVVAGVLAFLLTAGRRVSPSPRSLDVEMQVEAGTHAQLFWSTNFVFTEERSVRAALSPPLTGFQQIRFELPADDVRWIRFDPTNAPGEVLIKHMRLLDSSGQVLQVFRAANLRPAHQVASITNEGELTRVRTSPGGNDPFIFAALSCRERFAFGDRLSLVTPVALAVAALGILLLVGACILIVGADAFGRGRAVGPGALRQARAAGLVMTVLFLMVLSAKLLLIRSYPVTVPFADQWDAEAHALYIPYDECTLAWSDMFALHNEHRVFFSRVLALVLLLSNSQWDPRLQQVANASIHALNAVLLAGMLWIASQRRLGLLIFAAVLTFAAPFSWENTLLGFQSAFYFLLLFSLLALWLTARYGPADGAWYLGWVCAVCTLFTAAGGLLTPIAIAAVGLLGLVDDRRAWRKVLMTLVAASLVFGLGAAVSSPPLPLHEVFRAKTVSDFVQTLGRNLAWPWIGHGELAPLMWMPTGILLGWVVLRRTTSTCLDRFVVGLGLWVVLQAAAIAYGRGAGGPSPLSRYQDFLSLGLIANTLALGALIERTRPGAARRVATVALGAWVVMSAVGIDLRVRVEASQLLAWRGYWSAHEWNVRKFVVTGDTAAFTSRQWAHELPHPNPAGLASLLRDPYVRRILPASVREPVRLPAPLVTNDAFVLEALYPIVPRDPLARAWGSYTAQGNPARGRFESQPVPACDLGGYLQFAVAGYLGTARHYLRLRDLQSGRQIEVRSPRPPGEMWTRVRVSCPAEPYAIIAVDGNRDTWFAFAEPVEVGRLSAAAESLIAVSPELLIIAAAMAALAVRWV